MRIVAPHSGRRPRDGTEESQFPSRLEIALNDFRMDEETSGGKLIEGSRTGSETVWKGSQLKTIINAGEKPLDEVIVELKHPFSCKVEFDNEKIDQNPQLKKYFSDVKAKISKYC